MLEIIRTEKLLLSTNRAEGEKLNVSSDEENKVFN